jgi:hypothetical protein
VEKSNFYDHRLKGRLTFSISCVDKFRPRGFTTNEGKIKAQNTLRENGSFERSSIRMKNGGAVKAIVVVKLPSMFQKQVFAQTKEVYPDARMEHYIYTDNGVKAVDIFVLSKDLVIECDDYCIVA